MTDQEKPAPLGGLWTLMVGGVVIAVLLVFLQPITSVRDCPNYGASGNASAFANPVWDLVLPVIELGWILLVGAEQALPASWQNRNPWLVAARSTGIVLLAVTASCLVTVPILAVCH